MGNIDQLARLCNRGGYYRGVPCASHGQKFLEYEMVNVCQVNGPSGSSRRDRRPIRFVIGNRRHTNKEEAMNERVILRTMLHGRIHPLGVADFWRPTDFAPVRRVQE